MPKGQIPWNKGLKGSGVWLGKHLPLATRLKLSKAKTGIKMSDEFKEKCRKRQLGKKLSEETRKKLSLTLKGNKRSLGRRYKHTESTKVKIGIANRKNKGKKGSECNFWKGGIAFYPYPTHWTNTLKRSIRERDRHTCQVCKKEQGSRAHDIHHIDYNKNNCNPDNLITLCRKCHGKTNVNRKYWIKYFNNYKLKL